MTNSAECRHNQIRKILDSRAFRNTDASKRLLDYLARQALGNPHGELKEYTVGIEAFRKPGDYDPQIDSSVRVQASKLRQKLDEYYRDEGADDDLVVELPKGHFKLEFHPRHRVAPARFHRRWLGAGAVLLLLIVVAGIYLPRPAATTATASAWTSEMEEFWRPFLSSPRPVMLGIGTPLFVKVGNDFFRDPNLNGWDVASQAKEIRQIQTVIGGNTASPAFPYTGIGETEAALDLERVLLPRNHEFLVRASSQLTWEDIGRYNMIFLGPPKFNQQIVDLPMQQDFEILHGRVENLRPAAGEPSFFEEKWSPDRVHLDEGHALISRLPGLHRSGEMLILAGSSTESTRAAAEFVTRPQYVSSLVRRMHQNGAMPDWFQAVVHVRYKAQTPIAIELATFHALK